MLYSWGQFTRRRANAKANNKYIFVWRYPTQMVTTEGLTTHLLTISLWHSLSLEPYSL